MKNELKSYCTLHWWNMCTKTLSFKGELKDLLKEQNITFTKRKTDRDGIYQFNFKSPYGITFKVSGSITEFSHYAKQFLQMELTRMGDKATLYVACNWRPSVTINH